MLLEAIEDLVKGRPGAKERAEDLLENRERALLIERWVEPCVQSFRRASNLTWTIERFMDAEMVWEVARFEWQPPPAHQLNLATKLLSEHLPGNTEATVVDSSGVVHLRRPRPDLISLQMARDICDELPAARRGDREQTINRILLDPRIVGWRTALKYLP